MKWHFFVVAFSFCLGIADRVPALAAEAEASAIFEWALSAGEDWFP